MSKGRTKSRLFRVGEMPTSRIEAFSDGVFAIVITLLILSIQVPQLQGSDISLALAAALRGMAPKFLSYALSFVIACVWWVAHHHLFALLTKSDRGLLWLNSLFLFWLASVPFPTALLGDYPQERLAVLCYGAVMMMAGVSFSLMRFYAFYIGKLTASGRTRRLLKRAMIKSALNPLPHLMAMWLVFVKTAIALAFYAAIPILFFVPTRLDHYSVTTPD